MSFREGGNIVVSAIIDPRFRGDDNIREGGNINRISNFFRDAYRRNIDKKKLERVDDLAIRAQADSDLISADERANYHWYHQSQTNWKD